MGASMRFEEKVARLRAGGAAQVAQQTLSRRSLLDWLGKATVLALGGEVLAACDRRYLARPDGGHDAEADTWDGDGDLGGDGDLRGDGDLGGGDADLGGGDADLAGDADLVDGGAGEWNFYPPDTSREPSIYSDWEVRTVDRQILENVLDTWQLRIDGMVERPTTLNFLELVELPRQDQVTDFHCVEGWSVYDVPWNGIHLSTLLDLVGPHPEATHITFHTIGDRYNESLPLEVALEPRTMMAYGIAGHTLPLRHGFPVRLNIPRLLAYKHAKYVERIELTNEPIDGFWERLGYNYRGEVPEGRLREGRY